MDSSNTGGPSSSGVKVVTRRYLYDHMQRSKLPTLDEKLDSLENYLLSSYECNSEESSKKLKKNIAYFKLAVKKRWSKAQRKEHAFLEANQSWLNGTFELPIQTQPRPGRPSKSFEELSECSKRRKTIEVRSTLSDNLIVHAAQSSLRAKGQRNASEVLKEIIKTPTRARKYKKAYQSATGSEKNSKFTPHQALLMYVEADLTRRQYEIIRKTNPAFYPCYDHLLEEKKKCLSVLEVTPMSAEAPLQSLIDITIERLSEYIEEVLATLNHEERSSLTIICKWGCDGSQQAKYKQKLEDPASSDGNIFLSSFVPLQFFCRTQEKKVVWQNPAPSSPRFCRPIRFRFIKESTDVTKEEIRHVEDAARNLIPTKIELHGSLYNFTHIFKMTMIDGKVCNAATDTKSTSRCYICKETSKDFNKLNKNTEINAESLEFGLSVLHARIRLFESILHLAYKLPVQKYRTRKTKEEEDLEKLTKLKIQERFRNETGLLIDMPKCNFGNTNDGNTSRRFFENPQLAAEITGVDFQLINRLKIILETISCGYEIDTQKFDNFAFDTAKLYVDLYPWHPMTPTMHKVLIHGAAIIKNALLPIGQLSEEAQEARNKHFRVYRESYSRKFSREECNRDVFNRLLLSSDPLLSSIYVRERKKKTISKSFCTETINMLLPYKQE